MGKVATFQCDVSKSDEVNKTFAGVIDAFGKVDILINNAGASRAMTLDKITDEMWQEDLDLKLFAAIRLARLVWPGMQEQEMGTDHQRSQSRREGAASGRRAYRGITGRRHGTDENPVQ